MMNEMVTVLFLILGFIFGSFFNVAGLRIPKKKSVVFPASHCPSCGHKLRWYENIPVLSFIMLKGKCSACRMKISLLYPVTEISTGLLFAYCYMKTGFQLELAAALLLVSLLAVITVSDLKYMVIPDKVLLFFLIFFILVRIIEPLNPWWDSVLGALAGFLILYLLAVISRGGMGGGDIKLFFVLGIILGTKKVLLALFIASLAGALYGLALMVKKGFKKRIPGPFGPFIATGSLFAYFYGDDLISWYLHTFLYM